MKKILLLSLSLLISAVSFAQGQLSNHTKQFLQQRAEGQQAATIGGRRSIKTKTLITPSGVETVQCFLSLKNLSLSQLEQKGAEVNAIYGHLVSATVPVDSIETIAQLNNVHQVSVSRQRRLLTDVARSQTQAQSVHNLDEAARQAGLLQAYTGQGVVLGIIDDGIQFDHTAFKDPNGNTRIKAVYMPNATTSNGGTKKQIDGVTMMGYQYTTPTQISKLTTDDTNESHGTHTAGCAGGSLVGNYSGMAPHADLVLCGCGSNLSDAAISSSAKYIANYAKEQGKPCVISISLGTDIGPHDGSSNLCQAYDQIAQDYQAVILLAAGNEADYTGSVQKTLTPEANYIAVGHELIEPISGYAITGEADFWNSTGDALQVQVVVLDANGKAVYTSAKMSNGKITSSTLSKYFRTSLFSSTSGITITSGKDANNHRYNLSISTTLGTNKGSYKLCYLVHGQAGNTITAWTDCYYSQFTADLSSSAYTQSPYTLTPGNADCSICDDVTGKHTISVGAYASRLSFPYNHGNKTYHTTNGTFPQQDIADFSSYGTDFNGVQHPFVTAPGHTVVSSVNRYNTNEIFTGSATYDAYRHSLPSGNYDYWEYMSGTSMATPVAAGIVALYLQANPALTTDDVKALIRRTATTDHYTTTAHPERFGCGKINALAGIAQLVNPLQPEIIADPSALTLETYIHGTTTATFQLLASHLQDDITLTLDDPHRAFTLDATTITPAEAQQGKTITITFASPAQGTYPATISISSTNAQPLVINLTGESNYQLGDTNTDGTVDISDVVLAVNYLLGAATTDTQQHGVQTYGDMNADHSIDISDVVAIVNKILRNEQQEE